MSEQHSAQGKLVSYVPVPARNAKETGLQANPDSAAAHVAAFRAVLLHLIVEAFDLREEETLWVGYHLDQTLAPLMQQKPHTVPFPVRQEMLNGSYTRLLELRGKAHIARGQCVHDARVLHASCEDWAETLISPILESYNIRPITEATMRGQMLGLLRELGVGDEQNPRGATHLPTELRVRIFTDRSR